MWLFQDYLASGHHRNTRDWWSKFTGLTGSRNTGILSPWSPSSINAMFSWTPQVESRRAWSEVSNISSIVPEHISVPKQYGRHWQILALTDPWYLLSLPRYPDLYSCEPESWALWWRWRRTASVFVSYIPGYEHKFNVQLDKLPLSRAPLTLSTIDSTRSRRGFSKTDASQTF